ncbi:NAD(P)-binding protein [Epithele typhae]|uniref:NAD(P)-binding protein n=1 Tax=Epithele typhae TaxID=378194 RepID=UPI00200849DC|nr:NAD(P)-binding protein [Epithele typhae]KAH9921486.1 NAD(P)-binding protein [Epithele typhae]
MTSMIPETLNPATLLSKRHKPDQIPDLSGRVALVTGGSAGIGYWDVAALAKKNATVHFVSANAEHGQQAEKEINEELKKSGSHGSVVYHQLDMSQLRSVDDWSKKFARQEGRLDILIANAGIGQAPYGLTEDGIERHFEVNNLSHWVMVLRLLEVMKRTASDATPASVRIVLQSSEMHRISPMNTKFASKAEINEQGDGAQLYGRTKLGFILFAQELVRRKLTDVKKPILAISVHPGVVDTEVQKAWVESYGALGKIVEKLSRMGGKSAEEGAEASLWAATWSNINHDNWRDYQGKYFTEPYGKPDTESKQAQDRELANNFWDLCSKLSSEILGERVE